MDFPKMQERILEGSISLPLTIEYLIKITKVGDEVEMEEGEEEEGTPIPKLYLNPPHSLCGGMSSHTSGKWQSKARRVFPHTPLGASYLPLTLTLPELPVMPNINPQY